MAYQTDKELFELYEYYTIQLEEQLLGGEDFTSIAKAAQICISLNCPKTFMHLYINKKHVELTGFTKEEMTERFDEYIQSVHPQTFKSINEFLPAFYETAKTSDTLSFVQHFKKHGDTDFTPVISITKPSILPKGELLWISIPAEKLADSSKKMEQVVKMDEFKLKHFKRFQSLTGREIEILKLLANGYNNPKIADKLFLSRSTIETHRKNIKKKLDLNSLRDLMRYAFAFDLVEV